MNRLVVIGRFRFIPVILILLAACSTSSCGTSRQVRHNYARVPFATVIGSPTDAQVEILSTLGIPNAVWRKPFGIFGWVYCIAGSPNRVFDFDQNGALIGQGLDGRRDLCIEIGANDPDSEPANGAEQRLDGFNSLMKRAWFCFRQRHVPAMATEALIKAEEAVREKHSDFEANLLLVRSISHVASTLEPNKKRKWLAHRGYKVGKKLIEHYPSRVEGYYFAGINLIFFAETEISAAAKERARAKIEILIDQAIRIDIDFMQGAPLMAKAKYLVSFPQDKGDREWATKIMTEAALRFPKNPCVDLYFVDLAIEDANAGEARKLLKEMIRKIPAGTDDYSDRVIIWLQAIQRMKTLKTQGK